MNLYQDCLDEIALEGLDGITLPTLWLRLTVLLKERTNKTIPLVEKLKNHLWRDFTRNTKLQFYLLPTPRDEPDIFNR